MSGRAEQELNLAVAKFSQLAGLREERCSVRDDGPGCVQARFYVRDPLTAAITPPPLATQPTPPGSDGTD